MSFKVWFVHPDLGIGGAERLVVDAAIGLQDRGHDVSIFTAHRDKSHCFKETADGTLDVRVWGDWLPVTIANKGKALFSSIRMIFISFILLLNSWWMYITNLLRRKRQQQVIFIDQVSTPVPILRYFSPPATLVVFYCHFPDKLLVTKRVSWYRWPLDYLEEVTTKYAHLILVNSKFTAGIFKENFRSISQPPVVVYPAVDPKPLLAQGDWSDLPAELQKRNCVFFVSLNRYEEKKNIRLAVEAFGEALSIVKKNGMIGGQEAAKIRLCVAGGYDKLLPENDRVLKTLIQIAKDCGIEDQVIFRTSIPEREKAALLKHTRAILYTPSNEHFGIVPVEAMFAGKPVLAVNSGGPTESVVDEQTGFLRPPLASEWAKCLVKWLGKDGQAYAQSMGKNGMERAERIFSFDSFASSLDALFTEKIEGLSVN